MKTYKKHLDGGFTEGWTRKPWLIVIHFTAGYTENQCRKTLGNRNISVHNCIDRDGKIYEYVPTSNRTAHAGKGRWAGKSWLNHHSLGIELVNFGWGEEFVGDSPHFVFRWNNTDDPELLAGTKEFYRDETYKSSDGKTKTARVITRQPMLKYPDHREEFSDKLWSAYTEDQLKSTVDLVWSWMKKYSILPENVIGHEHISPGRKTDPGPGFQWRKLEDAIEKKIKKEYPQLIDPSFEKRNRVKAVQSHCSRMNLPVGDIDGYWGPKTLAAVNKAIELHKGTYKLNLDDVPIDDMHCYEIANALRLIPGE